MEYKILTGTYIKVKNGFFSTLRITYCGMPSDSCFVLSPFITHGYQGFSPNVYYPIDSGVIHVLDRDFEVLEVTPEYIILGD